MSSGAERSRHVEVCGNGTLAYSPELAMISPSRLGYAGAYGWNFGEFLSRCCGLQPCALHCGANACPAAAPGRSCVRGGRRTLRCPKGARCFRLGAVFRITPHPRPLAEPRAHRVERDIAQGCAEMILVHRDASEPPLPEMSAALLPRMHVARVVSVQRCERAPQRIGIGRNENQMDVIGHQHPSPDFDTGGGRMLGPSRSR